jgi:hypothetical protein
VLLYGTYVLLKEVTMRPHEIVPCRFYLKKDGFSVREVQVVLSDGQVAWRDYNPKDGKPYGSGVCSLQYFATWAGRELTASEAALMQTDKATELQLERRREQVQWGLDHATNEELLAEVRIRGYEVLKKD